MATRMPPNRMTVDGCSAGKKNTDIEILRAAAILFVLLSHLPINTSGWLFDLSRYVEMWAGVDLFFVISGYLITCSLFPLLDKRQQRAQWLPELKEFWIRRVFRLLPAAWLWLLLPLLMSLIWGEHPLFASTRTMINDALAAFFQVANLYWAWCIGGGHWGQLCSMPSTVGPYWSLSLEEQFYLLLPLVLVVLPRRVLLPALITLLVLHLFWQRPIFTFAWYVRPDGLLWGVLLALLSRRAGLLSLPARLLRSRVRFVLPLGLLGLLAVLPALGGQGILGLSTIAGVSLVSAALVFLSASELGFSPSGLIGRLLHWLGSRSYAVYLVHYPLYGLVQILLFPSSKQALTQWQEALWYLPCAMGLVLLAAELTHRYVEVPARDYGRRLARHISRKEQGQVEKLRVMPL